MTVATLLKRRVTDVIIVMEQLYGHYTVVQTNWWMGIYTVYITLQSGSA